MGIDSGRISVYVCVVCMCGCVRACLCVFVFVRACICVCASVPMCVTGTLKVINSALKFPPPPINAPLSHQRDW